jgi:hypothetical protein
MSIECMRCKNTEFKEINEYDGKKYRGKRLLQCQTCGKACLALSSRDPDTVIWLDKKDEVPRKNFI